MNGLKIRDEIVIENLIYEIRGKQVMLDSDLAKLYEVETKQLNRQVKRNIERFDEEGLYEFAEFINGLRAQNQPFNLNQVIEGVKLILQKHKKN